jgi:hypothetical protein
MSVVARARLGWFCRTRTLIVVAVMGAVVVGSGAFAPSALAYWQAPGTGACASVTPPPGQSGGEDWVDSATGTCESDKWISSDEESQLMDRSIASADEATGDPVPADISPTDVQAGSSFWDSLETASGALKANALDFLISEGSWANIATLPGVGLGVTSFVIGWKVGSAIADVLGIDSGTDSGTGGGGNTIMVGPASVKLCAAGMYLPNCTASPNDPSSCSILVNCQWTTQPLSQDEWVTQWETGGGPWSSLPEPCYGENNIPVDAEKVIVATGDRVNTGGCPVGPPADLATFIEPLDVVALPGPGQGAVSPDQTIDSSPPNSSTDENQQRQNVQSLLSSPGFDPIVEQECAYYGPSGPCPFWSIVPTPQAGEPWSQYQAALQNLGFTNVQRSILSSDSVDLDEPASSVTVVYPTPGTPATTSQTITVYTNPDNPDMPAATARETSLANTLEAQNPAITDTNKLDVARSCLERVDAGTGNTDTSGDSGDQSMADCSSLPIFISGQDVRQPTDHDLAALGAVNDPNNQGQTVNPAWVLLTRDVSNKDGSGWYSGTAPCTLPTPGGMNCDEYPFFSTTQGGPGANLKYVDGRQNTLQGRRLQAFYDDTNNPAVGGLHGCNVQAGEQFLAIPLPDGVNVNTTWACNASQG